MAEALTHVRVVELSNDVQAAYCGRQFAAWGAKVAVVEPPHGHPLRAAGPRVDAGPETVSLLWEFVAAGKASVILDLDGDVRAPVKLTRLLRDTDVFVTDWKQSKLRALGLDYEALAAGNPGLVVCHLSPFGLSGPYSDFEGTDLIVQAVSGFMSFNGAPDREPVKAPANLCAFVCGVSAFIGAMAALRERRLSGLGQLVESAYAEALASITPFLRTEYFGVASSRTGTTATGLDSYETRDGGWVYFSLAAERAWESFVAGMGLDEASLPEELLSQEGRTRQRERLKAYIAEVVREKDALDVFITLNTLRITTGILFTPEDLIDNPHLEARGFLHDVDHPKLGRIVFPGAPGIMSATPMAGPRHAPELGTWNRDSGGQARGHRSQESKLQTPTSEPPLRGLRVLDLTAAWIGTYATMLLGDLGADIIKVESPTRPDVWRGGEGRGRGRPPAARPQAHIWNINGNFNSVNRNKRDLCLDLDTEKGKQLFLRLAERADLVMENYTPRVMDNFGLGYSSLSRVNEDVVMVSFSGFGATGPYADFRAIGASTEMHAGWDSLMGYPDRPPIMLGAMYADAVSGLQMAAMALVALEHRGRTGEGQRVEGGMFEASVSYIGEELIRASLRPGETRRTVNRHPDMAPHGVYPCAGDDHWIAVAVRDDEDWQRLLRIMQQNAPGGSESAAQRVLSPSKDGRDQRSRQPRLDRAEYRTPPGRLTHADTLDREIATWTQSQDAHDLMRRLQAAGVPAGVVLNTAEVLEDQHFRAREWFISQTHPDMGTHRYNGFAWRFSRTPPVARNVSPRLGEHSREVLASELGLSAAEIEALFAEGVTGEVFERAAEELAAG